MAAAKGNEWWRMRENPGRKLIYTPKTLLAEAHKYFKEVDNDTSWNKQNWVGKEGTEVTQKVRTPYTRARLCVFLGVNRNYLKELKLSEGVAKDEAFSAVIAHIESVIDAKQTEGAIVGDYNANIISRLLGLADKQELSGKVEQALFGPMGTVQE